MIARLTAPRSRSRVAGTARAILRRLFTMGPQAAPNPRLLRSLLSLCLAAVVLAGALGAGRTYLWCSMMQRPVETCCCAPDEPSASEPRSEPRPELRSSCCESRGTGDLASAVSPSHSVEVPPAAPASMAPVAVLPAVSRVSSRADVSARSSRIAPVRAIRAGPRGASDTCVRLQVFRC